MATRNIINERTISKNNYKKMEELFQSAYVINILQYSCFEAINFDLEIVK